MLKSFFIIINMILFVGSAAWASPASMTYQGRIVKDDGTPLQYSNVSFLFQITSPNGLCVVYEEQVNAVDMSNSKGLFDTPIGMGTKIFPTNGAFTIIDSLNNSSSLTCKGGSTYVPAADDGRKLRVHFHDGVGWKLITPDNVIRSVPYAGFASSAMMLGTNVASDFVLRSGVPVCASGYVLTSTASGVLSCIADAGGASGAVNTIAGSAPIMATDNGSGAYTISVNVGTIAGTLAAGNDSRFSDARTPTGTASGDLSGTYPAPTIAAGAVTTTKVSDGSITAAKLSNGSSGGQVPRFDGSNWSYEKLKIGDLVNASGLSPWPAASCGTGQFLTWISSTDTFDCVSLTAGMISTALGFTPTDLWSVSGSDISRASGKVGIGLASPGDTLEVRVPTNVNGVRVTNASGTGLFLTADYPGIHFNTYWDGTQYIALGPGYTGEMVMRSNDGRIDILTGTNPGAGATATLTRRMVITNAGNVGIGNNNASDRLDISAAGVTAGTNEQLILRSQRTGLLSGNLVGGIIFKSDDSSFTTPGVAVANISAVTTQDHTTGQQGTAMLFKTTANSTTSAVERLRIDATGYLGIGTSSPQRSLHVVGSQVIEQNANDAWGNFLQFRKTRAGAIVNNGDELGYIEFRGYDGATQALGSRIKSQVEGTPGSNLIPSNLGFYTQGTTGGVVERIRITPDGNVGIGLTNPSYKLDVNGTIRGLGITDSSDERLKKDIRPVQNSLDRILELRGVTYFWKDSDRSEKRQIGLIAQEVEKIFPELVETDDLGMKSVNYSHLISPAVSAIKELYGMLITQNKSLEDLKEENLKLQRKLETLTTDHALKMEILSKRLEELERKTSKTTD